MSRRRDDSLDSANGTGRNLSASHKSAKTRPRFKLQAITEGRLQGFQSRRQKLLISSQSFHRAIAAARWNERDCGRAAIKSEIDRALRPKNSLLRLHEWRLHKNEHTQVDIVQAQESRGVRKLLQRHALIELRQNIRVNRFQPHGDFEAAFQAIAKAQAIVIDESGMVFDDQAVEVVSALSDCVMVFDRYRARIKKAAAIVELQYAGRRKLR